MCIVHKRPCIIPELQTILFLMPTSIDTDYKEMYPGEYAPDDVTDTIDESDCLSERHNLPTVHHT